MHWKRVSPVDGWRREFCAYSAQPRNWFQEFWWAWQKVRRNRPISWIFLYRLPVGLWMVTRGETYGHIQEGEEGLPDCGKWIGVLGRTLCPLGCRNTGITWLNRFSAVSMAVGKPLRGRRRQLFENLSTITRIQVLPLEAGRSVMKSTPKCDHGRAGTGSGRSLPDGRWRGLLEMAQSGHPCTNPSHVSGHIGPPEAIF